MQFSSQLTLYFASIYIFHPFPNSSYHSLKVIHDTVVLLLLMDLFVLIALQSTVINSTVELAGCTTNREWVHLNENIVFKTAMQYYSINALTLTFTFKWSINFYRFTSSCRKLQQPTVSSWRKIATTKCVPTQHRTQTKFLVVSTTINQYNKSHKQNVKKTYQIVT